MLAGLMGIIFATLAQMRTLKKDFEVANQTFVFKKFLEKEWIGIASNVCTVIILAIVLPEIIQYKPGVENWVRGLFVVTGAIGSWAFSLFLGGTKKYIRKVVDEKTNKADNVENIN